MKKIFFLMMTCGLMSCSSDDSGNKDNYVMKVGFYFNILNSNNEDLLNKNTPNNLNSDDIRIEHLNKNGNYDVYFYEYLDSKYGYEIYTDKNPHIFAYGSRPFKEYIINNKITGIIKWNTTERDTIVTEISETPNTQIETKVWVNGELKYDMHNGLTPEVITIVK